MKPKPNCLSSLEIFLFYVLPFQQRQSNQGHDSNTSERFDYNIKSISLALQTIHICFKNSHRSLKQIQRSQKAARKGEEEYDAMEETKWLPFYFQFISLMKT